MFVRLQTPDNRHHTINKTFLVAKRALSNTCTMQSRICLKVRLCQALEGLDDCQCQQVLEFIQCELGCQNICHFLRKLLFINQNDSRELFTNQSLKNIYDKIQNTILQSPNANAQNNNNNNHNSTSIHKTKPKMKQVVNTSNFNSSTLIQLPLDLMSFIGYWLNRHEILSSELCCRIWYKIINNENLINNDLLMLHVP